MRRITVVMFVLLAASVAHGQEPPKQYDTESTKLFEQGRDLAKAGNYAEACKKFEASLGIANAPGTALNYGDCLEHLNQFRKALEMYESAAVGFDRDKDARAKFARERADTVVKRLATITIRVGNPSIAGLTITVGTTSLPVKAEITERFDPGDIEVTVSAPDHEPFTQRVAGTAGTVVVVDVPATLGAGGGGSGTAGGGRSKSRVRLSLIVGGVGVVGLVTSGILGLSSRSMYNRALDPARGRCDDSSGMLLCTTEGKAEVDDAISRANVATAFLVGGGVLVGAAAALFFTAPREVMTVSPVATATTVGLELGGRF